MGILDLPEVDKGALDQKSTASSLVLLWWPDVVGFLHPLNWFLGSELGFSVVIQSPGCVPLFCNPQTASCQAPRSFTTSWSLPKLMFIELVMPSNHLILCHFLLLLPSILPNIRVFSNESVLRIRWPKYWSFSFNISPSNECSRLIFFRVIGSISLLPKGLLRVFSSTTVWRNIDSSALSIFYCTSLTYIQDYWKNHSFDYTDLCRPSNVAAFQYTV